MRNTIVKDCYRDIKKSLGRFLSIVVIVALGVAVFSGLKVAPIYMKNSVDKYYDDYNLMDIRVLSTLGLTEGDIKAIKDIEGVDEVFATYSKDLVTNYNSEDIVIRLHGLPLDKINSNDYMNRLNLTEGRLPEKSGEVVIDNNNFNGSNIEIGSKLPLTSGTDTSISDFLYIDEVTVVGIVESPYYLSAEKGSSLVGNGTVRMFMMISQDDFKMPAYSEAFVTVKGAKDENTFEDNYFEVVDKVKDKIEGISPERIDARYNEILEDATSELNKGKEDYENEKYKVLEELESANKKIEETKNGLLGAQKELDSKKIDFNNNIKNAEGEIEKAKGKIAQSEEEYNKALKSFNEEKPKALESIKLAEANLEVARKNIDDLKVQLNDIEGLLKNPNLSVEDRSKLLAKQKILSDTLADATNKYNISQSQLAEKKKSLEDNEKKLKDTKISIDASKTALISKEAEVKKSKNDGERTFTKKQEEINNGNISLENAIKEYEDNKKKVDEELLNAENDIKAGEDKLSEIKRPEWHVLNRKSHLSYVDFENAANNINSLSTIFPVIFFLVAALVCLTTMTRMVDEQRGNIGTLKALGYSKSVIASKFIVYAFLATLVGSLIGLWIGFLRIPSIIYNTQGVRFILPKLILSFNVPIALGITLLAIGITTFAAFSACNAELVENPSNLMRPKAPKEGKRILFERIPFLWNKLSFIGKVTVRNIFRYKKRFIMTVLGIAGCTGLLLTGFGIKDSIKIIVDNQYGKIFKYDMTINLNNDITDDMKKTLEANIASNKEIENYDFVNNENCKISSNGVEKDLTLVVPKNLEGFDELIHLQDGDTSKALSLGNDGAIISKKVAKIMNVNVGDEIEIKNSSDIKYKVKISGIAENYILNYMYMSPSYYKEVFNEEGEFNSILTKTVTLDKSLENTLANNLTSIEGVNGVSFNSTMKDSFNNVVKSLDNVVMLMIAAAGALAFVVLYNLTNVNISERMREVATIKVLGFYDKEVSSYIYRENIILTLIGAGVGLGFGVITHGFVMGLIEMDNLMFTNNINLISFIIAVILTMLFSVIVNFTMYYKLKNINMIESLKSVD